MRFKKLIVTLLIATLLVPFVPINSNAAEKPRLNKTYITIAKGTSYTLSVNRKYSKKVKWKSANKKNVSVSKAGKIKAKKKGTTYVTATISKQKLRCKINVMTENAINSKIKKIYDWSCDKVWNEGYCTIYHYVEDGTGAVGETVNYNKTVKNLGISLKKEPGYNTFMNSLVNKQYKKVKSVWKRLYTQSKRLKKIIDTTKLKPCSDPDEEKEIFPYQKYSDAIWDFFATDYS